MQTVSDSNYVSEVDDASDNQIIVVNFSAAWCNPCKAMRPKIEELESQTPGVKFVYCDVDEAPIQTVKLNVMSVPSYVVVHKRLEHKRFSGSGPNVISGIEQAISELSAKPI